MPTPLTDVTPDSDQEGSLTSSSPLEVELSIERPRHRRLFVSQFVQVAENSAIKAGRRRGGDEEEEQTEVIYG